MAAFKVSHLRRVPGLDQGLKPCLYERSKTAAKNSLLTEEMRVQEYVPYGAIAGAALAVVMIVLAVLREGEARDAAAALADASLADPDAIIRAQRVRRAQQYLADRAHAAPGAGQISR